MCDEIWLNRKCVMLTMKKKVDFLQLRLKRMVLEPNNYLFIVTNIKLYCIHMDNSYNYITFDISYANHPEICLFGPPLILISLDSSSSTV